MSSEPHGRAWLLLSECFLPSFFSFLFSANVDDTLGFLLTPQISGIFNGEARELMWSRAECAARRCAVITACFFPPHARTRTHIRKHTLSQWIGGGQWMAVGYRLMVHHTAGVCEINSTGSHSKRPA